MKKIVDANTEVKEMARRNPRRVRDIVRFTIRRDTEAARAAIARVASRDRIVARRRRGAAEQTDGRLLVGGQGQRGGVVRHGAGHETRIVPPAQRCPRAPTAFEDVLHIGGLLKLLIVIDPEIGISCLQQHPAIAGR